MIYQDSTTVETVTAEHLPPPHAVRVSPKHRLRIKPDKGSNGSMNGPLYMQTPKTVLVRRLKRKDDGAWKQISRWFVENQVGFSLNLISLLFLAHASIPKARDHTVKFFNLSYYNPKTGHYGTGFDDIYLISFCVVLFTGLRAGCMEYILAPFGKWRGLSRRKDITRFSEQAWLVIYAAVFWSLGMYIYATSPYWLNLKELWTNWPTRELGGLMKGYMLLQWSFWLQQVIVINIEDRRKDYLQMLTHHFITISLIYASYCYHHTRVGNLILVIMDVVDILLPLAKCLKYLGHTILCDYAFGAFMITWFFTRHVAYMIVVHSVWKDSAVSTGGGCYKGFNDSLHPIDAPDSLLRYLEPFHDTHGVVCYNETVKWAFLGALLSLQVLTIAWFVLIIKVAVKVLTGSGAEDNRSGDEAGEGEEFEYTEAEPLEEDVGIEDIDLQAWERRAGVKRQASTSVSLPGHSDRRELLGRIGCEKQVD